MEATGVTVMAGYPVNTPDAPRPLGGYAQAKRLSDVSEADDGTRL
jgi:hypothetical protein